MQTALMTTPVGQLQQQTDTDEHVIALWLHGRPRATPEAYGADIARFRAFVEKPLREATRGDLQAFADSLGALAVKLCT